MDFNIVDLFYAQAEANPTQIALIDKNNRAISFGELEAQVSATAHDFLKKGIAQGDRVLVFVPMSIDLYRIVLALFRIGATAVFLDEWVSMKRMELCCQVASCKAFIGIWKARFLGVFSKELRKIPIWLGAGRKDSKVEGQKDSRVFPETFETGTALLTFTTGTTGIPKAAKRTHAFLKAQFEALVEKLEPQPNDIDMPCLPIVLLINLATGTPSVIADFKASKPTSLKPARLFAQIQQYQINRITASPFVIKALATYIIDNRLACPTIQKIFTGGAPVFPAEAKLYKKAFPTAKIEIVYGSTEAEPISGVWAEDCFVSAKSGENGLCVGKVSPSAQVKIIQIIDAPIQIQTQAELEALCLPIGSVGEIIVAGKHVLREYFNNEEALLRNKIFVEGECWHRMGDSGFLMEVGKDERVEGEQDNAPLSFGEEQETRLFLTGRCNMIIRRGDKQFFPFVYEHFFQEMEGVEMGTIVEIKGEIWAFVEIAQNTAPSWSRDLLEQKIRNLPAPIDAIRFLDKMPRDLRHNSRIDYQALLKAFRS
jgi:acyl-CoA synthetase (AMP-forming)/AMP-acid ligase II